MSWRLPAQGIGFAENIGMRIFSTSLCDRLKAAILVLVSTTFSFGPVARAAQSNDTGAVIRQGSFLTDQVAYHQHPLRTGVYLEVGQLRGCVLYLEGLGDSILNHEPLFRALAHAGYRTVSFDYYGQGGSSGEMSSTRLTSFVKANEIRTQAKWMWNYFSNTPDPVRGLTCAGSRRLVMGWSTGGLAGYQLAHERWAKGVVLLAPGIVPKAFVGRAAGQPAREIKGERIITERNLTRARYAVGHDPHVEGVKPDSPTKALPFALNLMATAKLAQHWKIDPSVKGLVLLSGYEDTYVNSAKTRRILDANTHFAYYSYIGALHELDNETADVRADLIPRTIDFLNSVR